MVRLKRIKIEVDLNATKINSQNFEDMDIDSKGKWRCASMHDPAGRRGIWFQMENGTLEVRAGREGDDAQAVLKVGQVITEKDLQQLNDALSYGAWMQEDYGPDDTREFSYDSC